MMTDQDFADLVTCVEVVLRNMEQNYDSFRHSHELNWAHDTLAELRHRALVRPSGADRKCGADYCMLCHPERTNKPGAFNGRSP